MKEEPIKIENSFNQRGIDWKWIVFFLIIGYVMGVLR